MNVSEFGCFFLIVSTYGASNTIVLESLKYCCPGQLVLGLALIVSYIVQVP